MPFYDYVCSKCGHEDTVKQSIADYQAAPIVPDNVCSDGEPCTMGRDYKSERPRNIKGYILLGDSGWHDKEYTRYRSIK